MERWSDGEMERWSDGARKRGGDRIVGEVY